ncbi:EAL domain-containing protein [Neobacillus dielmonensis]|uniref:EAL domain-containing protein n=1 Tax=Neobacillus dielmonensis TaxID=1347369 RepID=UPI0005A81A04|nr:EAL domain-containing protein [Neobacillus dielmonensis]
MAQKYIQKAKNILQWRKLFLPLSSLRFYPPHFVVRNPVVEGVAAAFDAGYEVAVIVFNVQNFSDLAEQLGQSQYQHLMKSLKLSFQTAVLKEIDQSRIITLHDFYGDGLTLFIKVDSEQYLVLEIDRVKEKLVQEVEIALNRHFPSVQFQFETGYMFVDKRYGSVQDSIMKAHMQAIAIAEKRMASKYNNMILTINKIIAQKNIRLMAQPIIDVSTNEIRAWEMLTRGPKGTSLENPLSLFSVAKQTGNLYELELIVIEKAFEQIKAVRCKQDIFINCTPLTLANIRFTRDLQKLMQKYNTITPKKVTIEVTESDSIDGLKNFIYNIKRLRLMGFRIAIDDTGAGYSNLSTISEIMPDVIKIDRSLIQNIDKNSVKESMLKGLMLVAREAGSLVVAEGIESEAEAFVLSRNQVHLAQGNFYAPPTVLMPDIAT